MMNMENDELIISRSSLSILLIYLQKNEKDIKMTNKWCL